MSYIPFLNEGLDGTFMNTLHYFEDMPNVGTCKVYTPEYLVTKDEIIEFGTRFDPLPFHMDEEAAKQSIYGGLTAPGVLTQCIAVKLISQSLPPSAVIGIVGKDEVKFPVAVRPDMRLHIEAETISKRPSSKPGRGLVQTRFKLVTHDGLEVYSALHIVLFETRPDGAFS